MKTILLYLLIACCSASGSFILYMCWQWAKHYIDNSPYWKEHCKSFYLFSAGGLLLWAIALLTIKYGL